MTRIAIAAILALTLAACGTGSGLSSDDHDQAWQVCGSKFDEQARTLCLQNQYRILGAQHRANEDAAAMMLLGGTAFMNGYNSGRSMPMTMCQTAGSMTICN